jgi:hypothetical protein
MNMREYPILHLDTNKSKGTALLLLFNISQSLTMSKTHTQKSM